jgi:hypothetical protein
MFWGKCTAGAAKSDSSILKDMPLFKKYLFRYTEVPDCRETRSGYFGSDFLKVNKSNEIEDSIETGYR